MSNKIALYTGSFDPITNGHLDIIQRASQLFDQLIIGIFFNQEKKGYFGLEARIRMIEEAISDLPNVTVISAESTLAVEVAKKLGAQYLVRGLRNEKDFSYEADMDFYNHALSPDIETIYLIANHHLQVISSSHMRELIYFGADLSPYVPKSVIKEVENLKK